MHFAKNVSACITIRRNCSGYILFRVCPYRCPNPTYIAAPKLIKRAIYEMKIKCQKCKQIFTIDQIEKHETDCQKPKCGCQDCKVTEDGMTQVYKLDELKFCSVLCKYTYLVTKQLEKAGVPDTGNGFKAVNPNIFAGETRKVIQQALKDKDVIGNVPVPMIDIPQKPIYHVPIVLNPEPMHIEQPIIRPPIVHPFIVPGTDYS